MKIVKRRSKTIKIGNVSIGGKNPIAIQSMTKVPTKNVEQTLKQIDLLKNAGCEVVRVAVKDPTDASAIKKIKKYSKLPLVADIHFDWRLAITAIDGGIDKIRLNPGNIFKKDQIKEVARAAKSAGIPIRVGMNSGSLRSYKKQDATNKMATAMVKEATSYIKTLERVGFNNIVVSLKASNILDTIDAYRKMSKICNYPFHLGMTATGLHLEGLVKSSIAIGALLLDGIGDTIRISLTDKPQEEVKAAKYILQSLDLRQFSHQVISCPTCGRCEVDLIEIVKDLEDKLSGTVIDKDSQPAKLAVMGCVVNGPGEAKEADLGIAFGKNEGLLFKKGRAIRKVSPMDLAGTLLKELEDR